MSTKFEFSFETDGEMEPGPHPVLKTQGVLHKIQELLRMEGLIPERCAITQQPFRILSREGNSVKIRVSGYAESSHAE